MNNRAFDAFVILLKREMWENRNLFISAPIVLTILLIVGFFWMLPQLPEGTMAEVIDQMSAATQGLSVSALAPLVMPIATPFIFILYICTLIYLINALYQDRKDSSILFWQSMPVSNLNTVMSKVVTVCFVAPLFTVAAMFILFFFLIVTVIILGLSFGIGLASIGSLVGAIIYSLLLVYMTAVLAAFWLFPTAGWLLLFSAFSKNLPFLWALGSFVLLLLLEDIVFGTQFLANWLESRTTNYNYIIFEVGDFFQRLFSYDMLFGIVLGSLLIVGAVYMRRFAE